MNKRLDIGLTVYQGTNDDKDVILKQMVLDFNNVKHRRTIAATARWAMASGHEMTTWPLKPGEHVEKIDSREGQS